MSSLLPLALNWLLPQAMIQQRLGHNVKRVFLFSILGTIALLNCFKKQNRKKKNLMFQLPDVKLLISNHTLNLLIKTIECYYVDDLIYLCLPCLWCQFSVFGCKHLLNRSKHTSTNKIPGNCVSLLCRFLQAINQRNRQSGDDSYQVVWLCVIQRFIELWSFISKLVQLLINNHMGWFKENPCFP